MSEIWSPLKDFESLYEISSRGRVKSLSSNIVLATRLDSDGYEICDVFNNGDRKTIKIHREMMIAFKPIDGYENLKVDHENGDRSWNTLGNLRWGSTLGNNTNKIASGKSGKLGVRFKNDRPRDNPWQAYAKIDGKFKSLGHFPTKEAADAVRSLYTQERLEVLYGS